MCPLCLFLPVTSRKWRINNVGEQSLPTLTGTNFTEAIIFPMLRLVFFNFSHFFKIFLRKEKLCFHKVLTGAGDAAAFSPTSYNLVAQKNKKHFFFVFFKQNSLFIRKCNTT